jgi:ferric-dicitrate binding protein FerR (iron transport regulator)
MFVEQIERFRREAVPVWDDLRARRVMRRAQYSLCVRRLAALRSRTILMFGAPGLAAVAALSLACFAVLRLRTPRSALDGAEASSHTLADGSRLELSGSARIEVRAETTSRVELVQRSGRVRYDVAPLLERAFVVHVRDAELGGKGTVFVVLVEIDHARVIVERGIVQVNAPAGDLELAAGEELVLASFTPDGRPIGAEGSSAKRVLRSTHRRAEPPPGPANERRIGSGRRRP